MKSHLKLLTHIGVIALISLGISSSASASSLPSTPASLEVLGSADGKDAASADLIADVNSVERNEEGNLTSVTWSITNENTNPVVLTWLHDQSYSYSGPYFSGVTAISGDEGKRFHPVMDGSGKCLCSGNTSQNFSERIIAGKTTTYWSLFSIPSSVESLTVEIPGFEPIEDIPIS